MCLDMVIDIRGRRGHQHSMDDLFEVTVRQHPRYVDLDTCVGCGLCGEVAHAAILCPSFFRAEIVQNPGWWDRALARVRAAFISWLAPA